MLTNILSIQRPANRGKILLNIAIFVSLFFCLSFILLNSAQAASAPSAAPSVTVSSSPQALNITIVDTTNAAGSTEYAIYNTTTLKYLDANGAPQNGFFCSS